MDYNSARFNLTQSTPLMAPDMVEKLAYMAEKQLGKDILQGNCVSDVSLDTYTNKFLKLVSK